MSDAPYEAAFNRWYMNRLIGPDNPFDDAYVLKEIRWYGVRALKVVKSVPGISLDIVIPQGVLPDYFNKNYRIVDVRVPMLRIDGKLWMSLTPMEIQSQFLVINDATGCVGMAGLGMGYAALKVAQKEDVESVTVFEIDKRIIEFFKRTFYRRKGFKKISFVEGDARQTIPNHNGSFDFLYVDIYSNLLSDEVIDDISLFSSCVTEFPDGYRFWGQERVLVDAVLGYGLLDGADLSASLRALLTHWMDTPISTNPRLKDTMFSDLYYTLVDQEFIEKVFGALGMVY